MVALRNEARGPRKAPILDPYTVRVPPQLEQRVDALVERMARRMGETIDDVRRAAIVAVLCRGLAAMESEEGIR